MTEGDPTMARMMRHHVQSGELSAGERVEIADAFQRVYGNPDVDRMRFVRTVVDELGVTHEDLIKVGEELSETVRDPSLGLPRRRVTVSAMTRSRLTPSYLYVLRDVVQRRGGLKFIAEMRADIMAHAGKGKILTADEGVLSAFGRELDELVSQWFREGVLDLERVTSQSSPTLLERVFTGLERSSPHPPAGWADFVRVRLRPGARVFGLVHPMMPQDPLYILEVAITDRLPATMAEVLADPSRSAGVFTPTTAAFYSIVAAQRGLGGLDLGSLLIKRVVEDQLRGEFPTIDNFVTLSPIPGFANFLRVKLAKRAHEFGPTQYCHLKHMLDMLDGIVSRSSGSNAPASLLLDEIRPMERFLLEECERYLLCERRRTAALDPVANFHLSNGASLARLNWMADKSTVRLCESFGIIVNYRYNLDSVHDNHLAYKHDGTIAVDTTFVTPENESIVLSTGTRAS